MISSYRVDTTADPAAVTSWSRGGRLPYETAVGTRAREYRDELRAALGELVAASGEVLHATLVSPERKGEIVDTENVLLYNLNSIGVLASACRHGLRFERSFESPDPDTFPEPEHLHSYRLSAAEAGFDLWETEDTIAFLDWTALPASGSDGPALSRLWWPLRHAEVLELSPVSAPPTQFSIRLEVEAHAANAAALVKRIADSLVAALQVQPLPVEPDVAEVLQAQLDEPAEVIASVLRADERAVLGRVPALVRSWGASVQWWPGDHGLVAFELLLREPVSPQWRVRGEVRPVNRSRSSR